MQQGLKRLLAGIDLTNKLIAQADVFINENSGMSAGIARTAANDGKRELQATNRHQQWKKRHCNCDAAPDGSIETLPEDGENASLTEKTPWAGTFPHAGEFSSNGWGNVTIDGAGHGTYDSTYDRSALGTLALQGDTRTGYTGV